MSIALTMVAILFAPAPASATIVPGKHRCVATGAVSGYRGVQCADLDVDGGFVSARGQSLCQRVSDEATVQCAGIRMHMQVHDVTDNYWSSVRTVECGRFTTPWHDPACPSSGRFEALGGLAALRCGHTYAAYVWAEFVLPVSAASVSGSSSHRSDFYTYNPSGCLAAE
ncbi:hypothetical protein WEI85_37715 [Actinomycetes bacterium KLBMP 9797]